MKWTLLVIFAVISCSRGQDFASWCPNLADDTTTCMNQYRSQLQGIGSMFSNPSQIMNVQAVVTSAFSTICQASTLTVMENFYGCIYGKMWACIPSDWKKAFPDLDKVKGNLRFMCDNIGDFDLNCVASTDRLQKLSECLLAGTPRPTDLSNVDTYLKYVCSASEKYIPCADTAYGTCPKKTAEVMKKSYEYNVPVGCDACISKPSFILLLSFLILFFVNKIIF